MSVCGTSDALVIEGLTKSYGSTKALDGLDLRVPEGTVCGLLGPNGAGKTTTVRILATLLRADGGRALVAGYDVTREAHEIRRRIGVAGQYAALDEIMTGRENLEMWGRLYHVGVRAARKRAEELLEQFDLAHAADQRVRFYSGGMRRRLDLAVGFFLVPQVLFLDEPTTGLDPRTRNEAWSSVRSMVRQGTTVLLSTQYLEEADQLANQVVVIDTGRVIAEGSPSQLKSLIGGDRLELMLDSAEGTRITARKLAEVTGSAPDVDESAFKVSVPVRDRVDALTDVARALRDSGAVVEDVSIRKPTLDDVFLRVTERRGARKDTVA